MTCNNCDKFYLGQTGRPFFKRYEEHTPTTINLSNLTSNYAKHIVDEGHTYTNIQTNMKPIHICNKSQKMNAIEEYYIYKEFKNNPYLFLNDQLKFKSNSLYDTAIAIEKLTHTHTDTYINT